MSWLDRGENLVFAGIGILLTLAIGMGGLGAHIHAIHSRFGTEAAIRRYIGPWVFARRPRWYFSQYLVTDRQGIAHAVLTLGSDVKEAVQVPPQ